MMTNMQNLANEIKAAYENGYRFFGVRNITRELDKLSVGDTCPNSYDWDVENDCSTYCTTGETLDGASAIHVNADPFCDGDEEISEAIESAAKQAAAYDDEGELVLIASKDGSDWGFDKNEIVLENAIVIAVVNQ